MPPADSLEFVQVGSDISHVVLNQALSRGPDPAGQPGSPLLSATRRTSSVKPLGARREDFGSGDDDESVPKRTSSVEQLKRRLQRLTVDRHTLERSGPCVCVNVP